MAKKTGRHTSAFLLLLLAEGPAYGAQLLSRLETELPHCFADSADVYRNLQEMERNGWVETSWETQEAGPPRKWYAITARGMLALQEHARDIRLRQQNFEFFLARFSRLVSAQGS